MPFRVGGTSYFIQWWIDFADEFNGQGQIGKFAITKAVYSDASKWGYGAVHNADWLVRIFDAASQSTLCAYVSQLCDIPDEVMRLTHI